MQQFCLTSTNLIIQERDRKLRIFSGTEHPFHDRPLEPFVMPPRKVREMRPQARRALIRAQKKLEQADRGVAKDECDAKRASERQGPGVATSESI
jgi:large subunit ribosomal protein L13